MNHQTPLLKSTDVLIIGGGVSGLMAAFMLSKQGKSVTLADHQLLGKESSWAGGGILSPLYPWRYPTAVQDLAAASMAMYPDLCDEIHELSGINPQYYASGLLYSQLEASDWAQALHWAEHYQQSHQTMTAVDLAKLNPLVKSTPEQTLLFPHIANVRNPWLVRGLIAALMRLGMDIWHETQCQHIHATEHTAHFLQYQQPIHIQYNKLVLATGAWTLPFLQQHLPQLYEAQTTMVDHPLDIQPVKGQMLLFKTPPATLPTTVLSKQHYAIPRQDGHVLVGSTQENAGYDKRITAEAKHTLWQFVAHELPDLLQYDYIKQWAGLRPASPQGIPYSRAIDDDDHIWVHAGHFRNGVVMAPESARQLAVALG